MIALAVIAAVWTLALTLFIRAIVLNGELRGREADENASQLNCDDARLLTANLTHA